MLLLPLQMHSGYVVLITVNREIHGRGNLISGDKAAATEALRNGLALSLLKQAPAVGLRLRSPSLQFMLRLLIPHQSASS